MCWWSGKHANKLALLRSLGIRPACSSDLPDGTIDGHRRGLHRIADRPADGAADWFARGTIVLKTTVAGDQTMAWAPVVIDEVTIVGSRCGPFDRALAALEAGAVRCCPSCPDDLSLSKGIEALEQASSKSVMKVLLDVGRS